MFVLPLLRDFEGMDSRRAVDHIVSQISLSVVLERLKEFATLFVFAQFALWVVSTLF